MSIFVVAGALGIGILIIGLQILLLPIVVLTLLYGIAWLREAISDLERKCATVEPPGARNASAYLSARRR